MAKLPGTSSETGSVDTLQGVTKKELAELVHGLRKRIKQLEDSLESMLKENQKVKQEHLELQAKVSGKIGAIGHKNPYVK